MLPLRARWELIVQVLDELRCLDLNPEGNTVGEEREARAGDHTIAGERLRHSRGAAQLSPIGVLTAVAVPQPAAAVAPVLAPPPTRPPTTSTNARTKFSAEKGIAPGEARKV